MGERGAGAASRRTRATSPQMREIVAEAVRGRRLRLLHLRTISHKTLKGDSTPTLRAQEDELTGIAMGLKDAGAGFLEIVSDWNSPDAATEFAMLRRVAEACGRPMVVLADRAARPHRGAGRSCWRCPTRRRPRASPSARSSRRAPIGILLGLQGSQNPFSGAPTYKAIAHLPRRRARRAPCATRRSAPRSCRRTASAAATSR